jgi:hypothetical protein
MEIFSRYGGKLLAVDEAPTVKEDDWPYTRTILPAGLARQHLYSLAHLGILPRLLVLGRPLVKLGKLRLQVFDLAPTLCLGFRLAPAGADSGRNHRLRERGGQGSEMSSRPKHAARIVPISQLDRCGERWPIAAELDIAGFIFDAPETLMHTIGCVRIDMIDFTVDLGS